MILTCDYSVSVPVSSNAIQRMNTGDLMKEEEVLEWLRKNRYRPPEVGIFMYSLIAVTVAFVVYTIFILCFLRPRDKKDA